MPSDNTQQAPVLHPAREPTTLALLLAVFTGLAGLDTWMALREDGVVSASGVLAGLCGGAILLALYVLRPGAGWSVAAAAALLTLGEFLLGVTALAAITPAFVLLLPEAWAQKFSTEGLLTEAVVFALLALALWVAARAWRAHAHRQADAAKAQARELKAVALAVEREHALARAELQLLRAQVEPHFLWNTLGNVQHLIRRDPQEADRLTGLLIRYLRASLPRIRQETSTVREEFECARTYLDLMRIRMGNRLSMLLDLPPDLAQQPLPPLLLQTLVENAVRHGVEPKVGDVWVHLRAESLEGDRFAVEVTDNGVGLQRSPATAGTGLGLRTVRDRLRLMHGDAAQLVLAQGQAGGVTARLVLPKEASR